MERIPSDAFFNPSAVEAATLDVEAAVGRSFAGGDPTRSQPPRILSFLNRRDIVWRPGDLSIPRSTEDGRGLRDDAVDGEPSSSRGGSRRRRRDPPVLRKELLFKKPWRYYAALAFNLVGRTSWGVAISPHLSNGACSLLLGLVELVRRSVWTLFRVENEVIRTHAERRRRRRVGIRDAARYARAFRNSPLNRVSSRANSFASLREIETRDE